MLEKRVAVLIGTDKEQKLNSTLNKYVQVFNIKECKKMYYSDHGAQNCKSLNITLKTNRKK